jgi:hypothetical protein
MSITAKLFTITKRYLNPKWPDILLIEDNYAKDYFVEVSFRKHNLYGVPAGG